MIRSGLVSVTFRKLAPADIVGLTADARLDAIEWGGDVHVPPGDLAAAGAARSTTVERDLAVSSYGSYYRVGHEGEPGNQFDDVLATAVELGAPLIRVWAGRLGSAEATGEWRRAVESDSRRIADMAAGRGIRIAYEFHGGTLTDTPESARDLLERASHPNLRTYWQPLVGDVDACLCGLRMVVPWLANLHVYHEVGGEQRPLAEGREAWRRYLSEVAAVPGDRYALLEFVKGGSPEQFMADAQVLRELLAGANGAGRASKRP